MENKFDIRKYLKLDEKEEIRIKHRGFEVVRDDCRKHPNKDIKLPTRGSSKAMAYDFYAPDNYIVEPGDVVKVWTDVKAYMGDTEALILNVRSSMGGKFMLANTSGWIDAKTN